MPEFIRGKDITTMTKKTQKEKNKQNRVLVQFNTGQRTIPTKKDYNRQKLKKELTKLCW